MTLSGILLKAVPWWHPKMIFISKRAMSKKKQQNPVNICLEGAIVDGYCIPSDVLTRIVDGFQQIAWILGTISEDTTLGERSRRISSDLKKKYMIQWGVAKPGSYVLTAYPPIENKIDTKIMEILEALSKDDEIAWKNAIPDSRSRAKLCKAALCFLPKIGESWLLKYTQKNHFASLDERSTQIVKFWYEKSMSIPLPDEILTIKGELLKIDFEEKKVTVRYLPTHRSIDCYYLAEVEDSIIESRRDLIEVTGRFILDRDGHPERLTEVSSIQPVDLSPMTLSQYIEQKEEGGLILTSSLTFYPCLDEETKQFYTIHDESLRVDVEGTTRDVLMCNLKNQLFFLWDTYGSDRVDSNRLTNRALNLRNTLRKHFQEI